MAGLLESDIETLQRMADQSKQTEPSSTGRLVNNGGLGHLLGNKFSKKAEKFRKNIPPHGGSAVTQTTETSQNEKPTVEQQYSRGTILTKDLDITQKSPRNDLDAEARLARLSDSSTKDSHLEKTQKSPRSGLDEPIEEEPSIRLDIAQTSPRNDLDEPIEEESSIHLEVTQKSPRNDLDPISKRLHSQGRETDVILNDSKILSDNKGTQIGEVSIHEDGANLASQTKAIEIKRTASSHLEKTQKSPRKDPDDAPKDDPLSRESPRSSDLEVAQASPRNDLDAEARLARLSDSSTKDSHLEKTQKSPRCGLDEPIKEESSIHLEITQTSPRSSDTNSNPRHQSETSTQSETSHPSKNTGKDKGVSWSSLDDLTERFRLLGEKNEASAPDQSELRAESVEEISRAITESLSVAASKQLRGTRLTPAESVDLVATRGESSVATQDNLGDAGKPEALRANVSRPDVTQMSPRHYLENARKTPRKETEIAKMSPRSDLEDTLTSPRNHLGSNLESDLEKGDQGDQLDVTMLTGAQRSLLRFLIDKCKTSFGSTTPPITTKMIMTVLKKDVKQSQNVLHQLFVKGFVLKNKVKFGPGGYAKYTIPKKVLDQSEQLMNDLESHLESDPESRGHNNNYLINKDINMSKESGVLPPEWGRIDLSRFTDLETKVTTGNLIKWYKNQNITADAVQQSVYNFAYDLKHGVPGKSTLDTFKIFFGEVGNGRLYNSPRRAEAERKRAEEDEKALAEWVALRERSHQNKMTRAYLEWIDTLSEQDFNKMVKDLRLTTFSGPKFDAMTKTYFEDLAQAGKTQLG